MKKLLLAASAIALLLPSAPAWSQAMVVGGIGTSSTTCPVVTSVNPVYGAPVVLTSTGALCVSASAPSSSIPPTATTIYSGQQTVTASAVALPSQALVNGIVVTAPTGNVGIVYVGPAGVTTGNGYKLAPGSSISYAVTNVSAVFIIGTAADTVSFTGN